MACRLVPLNKNPGVRPIGICECLRRIVGKAVLSVVGPYVREVIGALQLCAGQDVGIEAAIHTMSDVLNERESDGILLVDAHNAFNNLNRQAALLNVNRLCPALGKVVINTYRSAADLFVAGELVKSREGTTQGDPLAMAIYAIATIPLLRKAETPSTTQVWFADDTTSGGKLGGLRHWWDILATHGPRYGYDINAEKSWLIVKPDRLDQAKLIFKDTRINITPEGGRHLGAALGSTSFIAGYIDEKVMKWTSELRELSKIAVTEPHAAYCAFTHGLIGHWTYLCQIMPGVAQLFKPMEDVICTQFIPSLLGRPPPGDLERDLLALPVRLGGLGIINPTQLVDSHRYSRQLTAPLVQRIKDQSITLGDVPANQLDEKQKIRGERRTKQANAASQLKTALPPDLQRSLSIVSERGASTWLSALPLPAHGFHLSKSAFRDAVHLRYGWTPPRLPSHCACGKPFDCSHAMSCPTGGLPTIRHNELRDLCAQMLTEVSHNVATEPTLEPLQGEQFRSSSTTTNEGARLDIAASGFWGGRFERTFFDVQVFNPNVQSNALASLPSLYRRHERQKRTKYEQRIREVEHASFCPLIWTTSGGAGPAATSFLKSLADRLSEKYDEAYSTTMGWLRCRLGFALVRSAIMCLRGARSKVGSPHNSFNLIEPSLSSAEGCFQL